MKVTYIEKGPENDFRRIDRVTTFSALSYWKPEGTSLLYFKIDRFNLKTVAAEDVLKIED